MAVTTSTPITTATSQAVQPMPSIFRLRRIQSAPRISVDDAIAIDSFEAPWRGSSTPALGSPLCYPLEVPEIRRWSATPSRYSDSVTSLQSCGRGDVVQKMNETLDRRSSKHSSFDGSDDASEQELSQPLHDYFNSVQFPASDNRGSSTTTWHGPHSKRKARFNDVNVKSTEASSDFRDFAAPAHGSNHKTKKNKSSLDQIYKATKIKDEKDDTIPDDADLKQERENAGPTINQCPILQEIFAKMEASDDEYTSDSDIGRDKKRKSIVMDDEEKEKLAEKFRDV
jgi:hypothetical protein